MQQNENEIKKKELFDLSLIFTEGDEDCKFGVIVKAKKDGQETKLMEFDGDSIGMCYHGLKVVLREVSRLHLSIFMRLDNCLMKIIQPLWRKLSRRNKVN